MLHAFGGALGYAPDADDLADVLGGRIETAHFVIHYAHTKDIDAESTFRVRSCANSAVISARSRPPNPASRKMTILT